MFGIVLRRHHAADQLGRRPDATGILPAAAAAAEPFPEDGPRRHQAAFGLRELAGERLGLAGRPHADGDERREQVGGNGQPRALGNVVDAADDLKTMPGADDAGEQLGQASPRALDAGRHDACGDHRGLQEPEVVTGEVEHLAQVGDLGGRGEVNAREPQHRAVDHPQIGLDRRLGRGITAVHAQVDRHVQHPRSLGIVHAEEEDVAPAGVREVHPHRRRFAEHRKGAVLTAGQQFGSDAKGVIGRMPDAKHPLVAPQRPHALADLIGERLQAEFTVADREGARDRVGRPMLPLALQKRSDRLLKSPMEQMVVAGMGNEGGGATAGRQPSGELEAMNAGQEKKRPHAVVEARARLAEGLECRRLGEQFIGRSRGADTLERLVADRRLVRLDDRDQTTGDHGAAHEA